MEHKFVIGQLVKIKDPGFTYCDYKAKFEQMGFVNKRSNPSLDSGDIGQIFAIGVHEYHEKTSLYAIRTQEGREALISSDGIEPFFFEASKIIRDVVISDSYTAFIDKRCIMVGCQVINDEKLQEIIDAAKEVGLLK